jgi:PST family polysaccharide transporter
LVVFSRLLTPAQLGIVAMVMAVGAVANVVGDFGLSLAAIQAGELTPGQKSNMFWTNTGLGLGMGVLLSAVSPALAAFYQTPAVSSVSVCLSLVFVLNGLAVQFRAELTRRSRFPAIALADGGGQLIGFGVGAAMAVAGFGYWSVVAMQLAASGAALAIVVSRANWLPGRPERQAGMRSLYSFGWYTFLAQTISYISNNIGALMIGRVWGSSAVGVYNRAYQLAFQPSQQIVSPLTRVFMPMLARERPGTDAYVRAAQGLQQKLCYVVIGILSVVGGSASASVPLILGKQWVNAGPLVTILAIAGAFQSIGYIYYWLILASGKTRLLFYVELYSHAAMAVLIVVLSFAGPFWVAVAVAIGQFGYTVALDLVSSRRIDVGRWKLMAPTVRPLSVLGAAGFAAWIACRLESALGETLFMQTLAALVAWALALAAACALVPAVRGDVRQVAAFGWAVVRRRHS